MTEAALYICYDQMAEPLVQTQVIPYLKEIAKRGFLVHLLSFERVSLSVAEKQAMARDLVAAGIRWRHLCYHTRPSLLATLYDIAIGTLVSISICKRHNIEIVHARSHVPAAIALVLRQLRGCRLLFDMRGLLAEEYVDSGRWKRNSLKFKLTQGMERVFFRYADGIVMLTERIKHELTLSQPELLNKGADIEVIPCCVDTEKFAISDDDRFAYRRKRGWDSRIILTYVGKLGGWYLTDEMARFFAVARREDPRFFFQILTQSDPSIMARALAAQGVGPEHYETRCAPPSQLPLALLSSDAGISFIRATHSKLASSPTKFGEYLAAGLPVVASAGIGDCDRMLRDGKLGVVVDHYSETAYRSAAGELKALIDEPDIRARCRKLAEEELSLSKVGGPRYCSVYEKMMGEPIAPPAASPYRALAARSDSGEHTL